MEQFTLPTRMRNIIYTLVGIGVLSLIMGVVNVMGAEEAEHHHAVQRLWG